MNWSVWVSPLCSLEMTCGWVLGLCSYTRAVSVWNKWTAVNKNQFSLFLFEYVINPVLCILIFQYSFPEYFFPKMEKNSKKIMQEHAHVFHYESHFDTWLSSSACVSKDLASMGLSSKTTLEKEWEKKKQQKTPLLIRFTFQITLMPDGLTNESPCTSFSVIQLWVIIQFDFWDTIRNNPNERLL